jgi:diguanylate cyclase (GGDEF)-like protein/PAS domain S-box-containing protein
MEGLEELSAPPSDHEALLEFLYVCPVGLMELAPDGAVELMNPRAANLLLPIAGASGIGNLFEALGRYAPDLRFLVSSFEPERGTICDTRRIQIQRPDPQEPHVLACSLIKLDERRIMAVLSDISEQVSQERRLKQAESWFSAILSGVNDFALLSLDATGRVNAWNASGRRQTGYEPRDVLGRTMNVFYFPDEAVQGRALQQVDLARRDGWHIDEGWRRRKDGSRYWCQSLVSALEEMTGEVTGFSVVLRDVTERKANGEEIRRLLTTDQLTGVANRARFFELAQAEISRWKRFGQPLSALMIDVDHFKAVNDAHGHAAGDAVLKAVAQCFLSSLRSIDVLGRMGGEEFALLLPSIDLEGAQLVAERLRRSALNLRPTFEGAEIPVTVSIGCAATEEGMASIDDLLKAADEALYQAKRNGRNQVAAKTPQIAA